MFSADDFARSYKLNRADFDADNVLAAQDATATLMVDGWLAIFSSIAA